MTEKIMKKKQKPAKRAKITPSAVIGILMGLSLTGFGFYEALVVEKPGAYYIAVLGILFCAIIGSYYVKK